MINNSLNSTESVDLIEKMVYDTLKTAGFRKFGRTLHRFVDGNISQVIHFQNGCPGKGVFDVLWVNLGIRVPESAERSFVIKQQKKYYQEYECNIRTRLGMLVDGEDTCYDLRDDPQIIGKDIMERIEKYVLPILDTLNSRQSILEHRREFSEFDKIGRSMILLDEAMIYGHCGETELAGQKFRQHYQKYCEEYQQKLHCGTKIYLRKGERITYQNMRTNQLETITAESDGEVVLYNAEVGHVRYLENLAESLGIDLNFG